MSFQGVMPAARRRIEVGGQKSEVGGRRSEVRGRRLQKRGAGSGEPEGGGRRSKIRGRRSEVRGQRGKAGQNDQNDFGTEHGQDVEAGPSAGAETPGGGSTGKKLITPVDGSAAGSLVTSCPDRTKMRAEAFRMGCVGRGVC